MATKQRQWEPRGLSEGHEVFGRLTRSHVQGFGALDTPVAVAQVACASPQCAPCPLFFFFDLRVIFIDLG